jgi:hypothetical protein
MSSAVESEILASNRGALKADIQRAIRSELEEMLSAPIFAQSSRCKNFLNFIVSETLAGNALQLKERTIGIHVFHRPNDYDTGDDSIVRVTANEVRKRLGQFYVESPNRHSVHIELPRGAYVPEFRVDPVVVRVENSGTTETVEVLPAAPAEHTRSSLEDSAGEVVAQAFVSTVLQSGSHDSDHAPQEPDLILDHATRHRARWWISVSIAVLVLVACVVSWRVHVQRRFPDVWASFKHSEIPVLVVLGAHDIPQSDPKMSASDADRFPNLILRKQVIPVDDASVIANLGSVLATQGVRFRITNADPTLMSELRRQPVILVGALDNKWSLRISDQLPYRLERVFPSGENGPWSGSIIDAKDPNRRWKVDFAIPMSKWQHDYAIIARLDDPLTGVPVLLEGGLGNNGSLAASEFLTSNDLNESLAKEPTCSGKKSFEAVIETEIVDAKPGPPHTVRVSCW